MSLINVGQIRNDDGSKLIFLKSSLKADEPMPYTWVVHNRHDDIVCMSHKSFMQLEECKTNVKALVAIISLAAINNFAP